MSLLQRFTRLWDSAYLHEWAAEHHERSGLRAFAVRQLEIFVFTARSIRGGEIARRAAALTYHTLLAIVPMLAVGFAVFKAFGGLSALEQPLRVWLIHNLAAGRSAEVGQWLDKFVSNISAGAIAGVGVLLLFYSAVALLTNSEKAFNRIWGIEQGRPWHLRFPIYFCMVTLGPALLGVSISVSAQLQSSTVAATVVSWLPFGLGKWLLSLGSVLAVCVLFVMAYLIVPNTKVNFRPALLGGIIAGLLWSTTKSLFVWVSAGSVKYSAVYGALGALPLLMIWLYISWVIVLFGVTYAYANQAAASGKLQESMTITSQAFREHLAVRLVVALARPYYEGEPAPTPVALAEELSASVGLVRHLLQVLERHRIVAMSGSTADGQVVPARDIGRLSLHDVVAALREREGANPALADDPQAAQVEQLLEAANAASAELLARTSVRALVAKKDT
jgi:membrane protein